MKLIPLQQWICDSCGGLIETPRDGWFEWYAGINDHVATGFRIVHHSEPCMYNDQVMSRQNKICPGLKSHRCYWCRWLGQQD